MTLPESIDLHALRRMPRLSFYFRYPLHAHDFTELRTAGRLRGYFAAKPLHGRITAAGRVDRSAGFDGRIAVLFIPSPARSLKRAQLLVTRMPKAQVAMRNGKRNWPRIRSTAEKAIREQLRSA